MGKIYVFIYILIAAFNAKGFVPIESLILGNVSPILKRNLSGTPEEDEKKYFYLQRVSSELSDSCSWANKPAFTSYDRRKENLLSTVATIQYASLNAISKKIAVLAKEKRITEDEFAMLSDNIVTNYCSENLSVISKKELINNLRYFYNGSSPSKEIVSPLGPYNQTLKALFQEKSFVDNLFRGTLHVFRGLCSWGGTSNDFGLLNPFLKSVHVNSYILDKVSDDNHDFPPVVCKNLICRPTELNEKERADFLGNFRSNFCYVLKKLPSRSEPDSATLKLWAKNLTSDDLIFQTFQLISALSNQPNLLAMVNGKNNKDIFSSRFDDFFKNWSKRKISLFSSNIQFEEMLKLRKTSTNQAGSVRHIKFDLDYGEVDKSRNMIGKISSKFDFLIGEKLIKYITNEIKYDVNWSLKKEKHLRRVLKEHVMHQSQEIYERHFNFLNKDYFFVEISNAIFDDISKNNDVLNDSASGSYIIHFYFGHYAMNYLRKLKSSEN